MNNERTNKMNNEIETIAGVKGEWRTVAKVSELEGASHIRVSDIKSKWHQQCKYPLYMPLTEINWLYYQAFFPLPTRKRKSRDRRLLEALLKCLSSYKWVSDGSVNLYSTSGHDRISGLTRAQEQQLVAIKEAMKKGTK